MPNILEIKFKDVGKLNYSRGGDRTYDLLDATTGSTEYLELRQRRRMTEAVLVIERSYVLWKVVDY